MSSSLIWFGFFQNFLSIQVNCLEPHPSIPVLATSGLDDDVKIWCPNSLPNYHDEPTLWDLKNVGSIHISWVVEGFLTSFSLFPDGENQPAGKRGGAPSRAGHHRRWDAVDPVEAHPAHWTETQSKQTLSPSNWARGRNLSFRFCWTAIAEPEGHSVGCRTSTESFVEQWGIGRFRQRRIQPRSPVRPLLRFIFVYTGYW